MCRFCSFALSQALLAVQHINDKKANPGPWHLWHMALYWHTFWIHSAKGDATTGSGNRIDVISNIEQQFDTKSGFICAQIVNLTWPVPKSVQEETRETSNNPHFYQVWSGLIWNTCKIHLKTRSVTDPIVGGLRREKNTHKWSIWLVRHKPLSKWLVLLWANHRKA